MCEFKEISMKTIKAAEINNLTTESKKKQWNLYFIAEPCSDSIFGDRVLNLISEKIRKLLGSIDK